MEETEPEQRYTREEFHRRMALDLFNFVWSLLEEPNRTLEDDDTMLHAAHASRYHWGEVGQPVNRSRGEWQIARVYAVLGRAEPALYHSHRCLEICEKNDNRDFEIAFAYEAVARAYAADSNRDESRRYYELAKIWGDRIEEDEERELFFRELEGEPWFDFQGSSD